MKLLSIIFLVLFTTLSQAKVWQATPGLHWDAYWDQKFQQWIKNDVGGEFFKELEGFKDLPLDCADAMYAFRIYFSWQHKLPWKSGVINWQRDKSSYPHGISNDMTNWDELPTERERVIALISFLIDRVGTESLANLDTYSVSVHDIKPGDLYMYKYGSDGSYTRHTYIVKEVNTDGTFDVLYATQLRAKKLWGLGRIGAEYLQHKPDLVNWGFKRLKSDLDINTAQKDIIGSNPEQYEIAKRVSEQEFFDYMNVSLRIHEETPTRKTIRLLHSLCRSLTAREIVVKDALEWQVENPNQCMNEKDYDAYSTPSRDVGITKKYRQLNFFYQQLEAMNKKDKVNSKFRSIAEGIFAPTISEETNNALNEFCKIEVSDGIQTHQVNLRTFYYSLENNTASFHPNDNNFRRWGVNVGEVTQCHTYYGKKDDGAGVGTGTGTTNDDDKEEKRPNLLEIIFGNRNR
jgi:hypothetical protein